MVMPWPKGAPGVGVNAERFIERVQAMSGGRLTITLYPAGELVPPFESFDAVQAGTADLLHGTPHHWLGKSQPFPSFPPIPFRLRPVALPTWLTSPRGHALLASPSAHFGPEPFSSGSIIPPPV